MLKKRRGRSDAADNAGIDNAGKQPAIELPSSFDQVTGTSSKGWRDVMNYLNKRRSALGKGPLCHDSRLGEASNKYAQVMAVHQSTAHSGIGAGDPKSRALDAKFKGEVKEALFGIKPARSAYRTFSSLKPTSGEYPNTAAGIIDGWEDSTSHWDALINNTWECMGYGEGRQEGGCKTNSNCRTASKRGDIDFYAESYHCIKLGAGDCNCR